MSGRTSTATFRSRKPSVAAAREHVRAVLIEWKLGLLVDDALLITSELATNALLHAAGTGDFFTLTLRRRHGILAIEVADSYQWGMPELHKPDGPLETGGRGLVLVDALSANWGVRPRDPGKTVWAHLPAQPSAAGM
jgi:anti-sigma regulatory factor (Ser/Thr protein kinase)